MKMSPPDTRQFPTRNQVAASMQPPRQMHVLCDKSFRILNKQHARDHDQKRHRAQPDDCVAPYWTSTLDRDENGNEHQGSERETEHPDQPQEKGKPAEVNAYGWLTD